MGIVGITVTLIERVQNGVDPFNEPIWVDADPVEVENVLVAPSTAQDLLDNTSLEGAKAVYTLAIPKSDTHNWENAKVEFWGETWKAYGIPLSGMDENIPLSWNKKSGGRAL